MDNRPYGMNQGLSAQTDGKDCTPTPAPFPRVTPEAMAYVPFQQPGDLYSAMTGLENGTIFPVLDKPFLGGDVGK